MHEVFEDAHFIYLILDWHQGVSLHWGVKGPLKEESALTILEQVLLTLDYMHKRGIIHCQISLESVLINNINNETEDTEISICSLGNVHVLASSLDDNICNALCDSPSFTPKI